MRWTGITAVSAIPLVCFRVLSAQPAPERMSFDVASVKAMTVDDPEADFIPRRSGDRITMHNAALGTIIAWAYHLTNAQYQLVAAPTEKHLWDDYDIQALAPGSPKDDDLRTMFQTLLEDRFQLKVHREKRELTAYDLVVARGGPKLVASLEEMTVVLTAQMRAPVRNRTGIAGTWDFDLAFSTGVDGSDKPVLATAIHDLGLNLVKSKGTFEVLVIDHVIEFARNDSGCSWRSTRRCHFRLCGPRKVS